ncbi:MAG: adenylate/guanylate cyclase domain-containing protein [Saprospiraceae bacterium]|nr:adenylate/guanylate cyclase domain-containing protein [Saprospiraceae bacterium]
MTDQTHRKLCAVLFADIAGYTAQMQKDETVARAQITRFRQEIDTKVNAQGGEIINFYGDGCVCIFESSVNAVTCAQKLQESFVATAIPVRIGIHSGDVYFEASNVYGDSVNIAARIESLATPGSVLFSERVRHDIKNQSGLEIVPLGRFDFKNVEEPLEIFALGGRGLVIPEDLAGAATGSMQPTRTGRSSWPNRILIGVSLLAVALILGRGIFNSMAGEARADDERSVFAILDFENSTGDPQFDIVSEMAANRIVHGITQNDIASVVTNEAVDMYKNVMLSASRPMDELDWLHAEMSVDQAVRGSIYLDNGELIFESIIVDARTKEIVKGLPEVRCSPAEPLQGIEELRQVVLGALAARKDEALNLSLETQPPKFEAYRQLLLAKAADDPERELQHLVQSIILDSNYFEPKVLLIAYYYNQGDFAQADSMLASISEGLSDADIRQKNLLNFYEALLAGKNNLIYRFMHRELEYAPFDLLTNRTVLIAALEFIYDLDRAREIYHAIPDHNMDFASCSECRIRLYLKMYMELELGNRQKAIRAGQILLKNNGERWVGRLLTRAYVELDSTQAIEKLISRLTTTTDLYTPFDLLIATAREYASVGNLEKSRTYAARALTQVTPETELWRQGEARYLSGDIHGAVSQLEAAVHEDPENLGAWALLAGLALLNNDTDQANTCIATMESMRGPYQYGDVDYSLAQAYGLAGDREKAVSHLKASIAQGQRNGFFQFQNDYIFHPLISKEELREIMKYWL